MAKKIVLIEDDEILSKVIYEDLQEAGYKVYRAFDGDEGLKMVKSEKPDMIILDLVLPKKDGFEVLKEIKKDNETKDIPVIIVSNLGQDVEIKTKNHEVITSKITQVSPLINEQTRQGTIFVDLNKDVHLNKIKAGMFLDGSISIGNANIMLIDQQAVILRDGFYFVFILTPENKVNQTKITIGRHFNNNIEILSGVTNNDQLVITGATFLRDQDVVNVVKETK